MLYSLLCYVLVFKVICEHSLACTAVSMFTAAMHGMLDDNSTGSLTFTNM